MFNVLRNWVQRYFSDEEAVVLAVLLVLAFTAVLTLGGMLAPVLAGMVLAYLMQGLVVALERLRVPAGAAVGLVFALFMGLLLVFMIVVVPLLWHQLITLFNELPGMLAKWQSLLLLLPERYPHLVSDEQVLQAIGLNMGREAAHYGVSIIRDRGIDNVALEAIIKTHGAENIVFVDGWTGKGAISGQIRDSLAGDSRFPPDPRLVVLADPCGRAWLAASAEDWLIPSGILGATVSGLVSRSIWPQDPGLHGCVVYDHLAEHDVTMQARVLWPEHRARPELPAG